MDKFAEGHRFKPGKTGRKECKVRARSSKDIIPEQVRFRYQDP